MIPSDRPILTVSHLGVLLYKMPRSACCVPGCTIVAEDGVSLHYFPNFKNDTERFQNWVKNIWGGIATLDSLTIQKTQRICRKHFRKEFHYPKNRLCKMAVPSLLLPFEDLTDTTGITENNDPDDSSGLPTTTYGITPKSVRTCHNTRNTQRDRKSHKFNAKPQKMTASRKTVCQICLSTDIECIGGIDGALVDFHNELVYYDLLQEPCLQYCAPCLHLLRKLYNFRQKCRRAHVLLKGWFDNEQNSSNQKPLESLQSELPKPMSRVELCSAESRNRVYDTVTLENTQHKEKLPWIKRTLLMKKIQLNQSTENSEHLPDSDQIGPKRRKHDTLINITNDSSLTRSDAAQSTNIRSYLQSVSLNDEGMSEPNADSDDYQECDSNYMFTLSDNCNETLPNTRRKKSRGQYMKEYHAAERLKFKTAVIKLMDQGEFKGIQDQGIVLTKELFAELLNKTLVKTIKAKDIPTIRKFLVKLLRIYNPVYETVFETEHLSTAEKKADEFRRRKDSALYLEAQYKCHLCYRSFESSKVLKKHMGWHEGIRPYACSVCPMRFRTRNEVNHHGYANHTHVFRCKFCAFYTSYRPSMVRHFIYHSTKDLQTSVFMCNTCHTLYGSEELLHQHQLATHGDHRLECSLCGIGFASHEGRTRHIEEQHVDASEELSIPPSERCQLCAASFHRREALDHHVLEQHTDRFMIKTPSGKVLWQSKQLHDYLEAAKASNRVITALNSKTVVFETCYVCDEVLHRFLMYEHFINQHPSVAYRIPSKKHLLCELCGKYLSSTYSYKEHMNCHMGVRPYECSECGARFSRQGKAAKHVKRHGESKYPCRYCDNIFNTRAGLSQHTKIHNKEQKYCCQICDKRFSYPSDLRYHIDGVHRNIKRVKQSAQKGLRRRLNPAFVKKSQDANVPGTVESEDLPSHGVELENQVYEELENQVYEEIQFSNLVFDDGEVQDYVEYEVQTQSDDESMTGES